MSYQTFKGDSQRNDVEHEKLSKKAHLRESGLLVLVLHDPLYMGHRNEGIQ
jgi:hypothetical protein